MYILAKLVFLNYIPEKFERGMRFKSASGEIYGFISAGMPLEQLIEQNGYPVAPYIMPISANPDEHVEPLAYSDQIGWWDDGPESDELRDVTNDDFNTVITYFDGVLQLEVSVDIAPNGTKFVTPELYMDKVTIGIAVDEELDDDEDYEDDLYDGDIYEDDLTDYDNPEWTHDHPKDKTDHDPED